MYDRVVVGLTTVPDRINLLSPVIAALRDQTRIPDAIYVTVPSKRDGVPYPIKEISKILQKSSKGLGSVLVLQEDYGPLSKLIGMWMHEKSSNTLLITANDDQIYSKFFVEMLLNGARNHPGSAICLCGHSLGKLPFSWGFRCSRHDGNPIMKTLYLNPDTKVTVVSGWGGCAYPRAAFGEELPPQLEALRVSNASGSPGVLWQRDDLYISSWLFLRGIKKYVVAYNGIFANASRDAKIDHAVQRELTLSDGTLTPIEVLKGSKAWWEISRKLQDRGLLEFSAVPFDKSLIHLSCMAGITVLATVFTVFLLSKN